MTTSVDGPSMLLQTLGPTQVVRLPSRARNNGAKALRLNSVLSAFDAADITHGAVLSFHHHFRNGDRVVSEVLRCAALRGLTNLTLVCSSIFPAQSDILEHIKSGVVGKIVTSYMKGPLADALSAGVISIPVIFQSHGGRARAITSAQIKIDLAIIGCSLADVYGNVSGRWGGCICGPLGYSMVDASHARFAVALADSVTQETLVGAEIPAKHMDAIIEFPIPGLPDGIESGTTLAKSSPTSDLVGRKVLEVIRMSQLLKAGFSFQTGAGGYSLASVPIIANELSNSRLIGGFMSGGITKDHIKLAKDGLFRKIFDVQSFDRVAAISSGVDDWHEFMSAEKYASPLFPAPIVNDLDVMIMGTAEIDTSFSVNVVTGGNGKIIGGPGGNPDTAEGAKLTIVTTDLVGGGYAKVVDRVNVRTTPGQFVDVLVTGDGIAVNPLRSDLISLAHDAGMRLVPIEQLAELAEKKCSKTRTTASGPICGVIEDRHGSYLDSVNAI